MLPRPLVVGIAVIITIGWAANLIVGFLYPGRSDPALNAIFAIVVGAVFALGRRDQNDSRNVRKQNARKIDSGEDEPTDRGGQA